MCYSVGPVRLGREAQRFRTSQTLAGRRGPGLGPTHGHGHGHGQVLVGGTRLRRGTGPLRVVGPAFATALVQGQVAPAADAPTNPVDVGVPTPSPSPSTANAAAVAAVVVACCSTGARCRCRSFEFCVEGLLSGVVGGEVWAPSCPSSSAPCAAAATAPESGRRSDPTQVVLAVVERRSGRRDVVRHRTVAVAVTLAVTRSSASTIITSCSRTIARSIKRIEQMRGSRGSGVWRTVVCCVVVVVANTAASATAGTSSPSSSSSSSSGTDSRRSVGRCRAHAVVVAIGVVQRGEHRPFVGGDGRQHRRRDGPASASTSAAATVATGSGTAVATGRRERLDVRM